MLSPPSPSLFPEPNPKRKPPSTMWLSMAPETDPAAEPIHDHIPAAAAAAAASAQQHKQFVGVGAPEMLIPFNLRSRTGSSGAASHHDSPSSHIGSSLASLRMTSTGQTPDVAPLQHGQSQQQQDDDESDEEPCCTPDHALANDAMVLLASSTTSSSFRDTSVGLPSANHFHHNTGTAAVKLVKTPSAAHEGRGRNDYFSMTSTTSSSAHLPKDGAGPASGSDSTITSSTRSSPPSFDFRNTFAPIAFGKGAGSRSLQPAAKVNGGGGIEFAGKQWSGKTAHAVEQEMEALGDRAIMSFAPDASYLASRLDMLRRNLEASNWERRPTWVGWQEEQEQEAEKAAAADGANEDLDKSADSVTLTHVPEDAAVLSPNPVQRGRKSALARLTSRPASRRSHSPSIARSEFALPPAPATSLIDAEYARGAHLPVVSNIEGATLSAAERSRLAQSSMPATPSQQDPDETANYTNGDNKTAPSETATPPPLDPAVRAAALDARVELRQLKRDDLMQVRELHCFHGDGNKSPGRETYTMSAGFLLRLLVDEKHVAVVAVKRPIPAPESPLPSDLASSIHSRFSPGGGHHHHHHHHYEVHRADSPSTLPRVSSSLSRTPVYSSDALSTSSMEAEDDEDDERDEELSPTSPSFFSSPADAIGPRTEYTQATSLPDSDDDGREVLQDAAPIRAPAQPPRVARPDDRSLPAGCSESTAEGALPAHGISLPPSVLPQSDSTLYERDADKPFLAGPLPVAPPLAVRVMAAPPPAHRLRSADSGAAAILEGTETVVGVATAQLTTTEPLANELWPGIDADDTSARGAAVEQVHVLTLSVAPDERSQGLGARLLERLIEECRIRIGHNSLRRPESISISGAPRSMRVVVECHPSNTRAIELYTRKAGFERVLGPQGTKKNFYRGDDRVPLAYRLKVGGTDAHVYERRFGLP